MARIPYPVSAAIRGELARMVSAEVARRPPPPANPAQVDAAVEHYLEQNPIQPVPGPPGQKGADGKDGKDGAPGADGQDGADGADGASAYEVAVANGFVGSEADWLASLVGPEGPPGADGQDGVGVPAGGAAGQVLAKTTAADHDTQWIDLPAGGAVSSVNGKTGDVVLTADDIEADNNGTPASLQDSLEMFSQQTANSLGQVWTELYTKAALEHTHTVGDIDAEGTRSETTFLRGDGTWALPPTSGGDGGGGAVSSVNGKTGDVVLDVDDIPELPASKIGSGFLASARIPPLPQSKVIGLTSALAGKANIEDVPEQRVHGGRIFIQETPPTNPEPGDIHLW